MKKQNNQRKQTILLATIATIILLGAFSSTFAQESKTNNNLLMLGFLSANTSQNLQLSDVSDKLDFPTNQTNNLFAPNSKSADGEYPKPDFSEIEKWYEIVRYEYGDFEGGDYTLHFWIKPKTDARPSFKVNYFDKDGVINGPWAAICWECYSSDPIGRVQKFNSGAPTEKQMEKITSVKITRDKS